MNFGDYKRTITYNYKLNFDENKSDWYLNLFPLTFISGLESVKCNSSKDIEKIASKWDDSNLLKKLNWFSKIIRNSIFLKTNQIDLKNLLFEENITYLANSKSLLELFELSNELNTLIDGLVRGVNLNNKIQIKAFLSSF